MAAIVAACAKDDQIPAGGQQQGRAACTITASTGGNSAQPQAVAGRTSLDNGGFEASVWSESTGRTSLGPSANNKTSLLWSQGDRLSVLDITGQRELWLYQLSKGENTSQGEFTNDNPGQALAAGGAYAAFFPYSAWWLNVFDSEWYGIAYATLSAQQISGGNGSASLEQYGILYSNIEEAYSEATGFVLNHGTALLDFTITPVDGTDLTDLKLTHIIVETTGGERSFGTELSLSEDGEFGSVPATCVSRTSLKSSSGHTFTAAGADASFRGYLSVNTSGVTSAVGLTITLITNKGDYVVPVTRTIPAGGFVNGTRYKTSLTLDMSGVATDYWSWKNASPAVDLPWIDGTTVEISTPQELAWVSEVANGTITGASAQGVPADFSGFTVELMDDIDLGGKRWSPIPTFRGTFDGGNHSLMNFIVYEPTKTNQGFINNNYGTVKNLRVASGSIIAQADCAPVVGGTNYPGGIVENCANDGCLVKVVDNNTAGGVVNVNKGIVRACVNRGTINGGNYSNIGGIASFNRDGGRILCCLNTGTVSGSSRIGGIVGYQVSGGGTAIVACIGGGQVNWASNGGTISAYSGGLAGGYYSSGTTAYVGVPSPLPVAYTSPSDIDVTNAAMNPLLTGATHATAAGGWTWSTSFRDTGGFPPYP